MFSLNSNHKIVSVSDGPKQPLNKSIVEISNTISKQENEEGTCFGFALIFLLQHMKIDYGTLSIQSLQDQYEEHFDKEIGHIPLILQKKLNILEKCIFFFHINGSYPELTPFINFLTNYDIQEQINKHQNILILLELTEYFYDHIFSLIYDPSSDTYHIKDNELEIKFDTNNFYKSLHNHLFNTSFPLNNAKIKQVLIYSISHDIQIDSLSQNLHDSKIQVA